MDALTPQLWTAQEVGLWLTIPTERVIRLARQRRIPYVGCRMVSCCLNLPSCGPGLPGYAGRQRIMPSEPQILEPLQVPDTVAAAMAGVSRATWWRAARRGQDAGGRQVGPGCPLAPGRAGRLD